MNVSDRHPAESEGTQPRFRSSKAWCSIGSVVLLILSAPFDRAATARAAVTSEEVERAIRDGVRFLKERQQVDGSWTEVEAQTRCGTTSLVFWALVTAV